MHTWLTWGPGGGKTSSSTLSMQQRTTRAPLPSCSPAIRVEGVLPELGTESSCTCIDDAVRAHESVAACSPGATVMTKEGTVHPPRSHPPSGLRRSGSGRSKMGRRSGGTTTPPPPAPSALLRSPSASVHSARRCRAARTSAQTRMLSCGMQRVSAPLDDEGSTDPHTYDRRVLHPVRPTRVHDAPPRPPQHEGMGVNEPLAHGRACLGHLGEAVAAETPCQRRAGAAYDAGSSGGSEGVDYARIDFAASASACQAERHEAGLLRRQTEVARVCQPQ